MSGEQLMKKEPWTDLWIQKCRPVEIQTRENGSPPVEILYSKKIALSA